MPPQLEKRLPCLEQADRVRGKRGECRKVRPTEGEKAVLIEVSEVLVPSQS